MSSLEEEIFGSGHPLLEHVFLWRRYVDDVFCIWTGPTDSTAGFLEFMNSFYPSIKFTVEVGGNKINFLDLTITNVQNRFDFGICRKTTATDILIHGSSFCSFPHKVAAFNSFIHRMVSLPLSPSAFAKEASILRQLAHSNSININIDGFIRRKMVKVALSRTTTFTPSRTNKRKRFVPLPYLPKLTSQLGEVIKGCNMVPIYYPYLKLGRLFPKGKDSTPPLSRSGVYLLCCNDCSAGYVGETGRSFSTRIGDHVSAYVNNNPTKSAFARHLIDFGHSGGVEKILYCEENYRRRLALEEIEIGKMKMLHNFNLLNRTTHMNELIKSIYFVSPSYTCTDL